MYDEGMTKKKLYYNKAEREFYWVKETPKTIRIDWHKQISFGEYLDQNVMWKNLVVNKGKRNKHPMKQNDEDGILIYPFQAGQPFYIEPATIEHIEFEIYSCNKWEIGSDYYKNLKQYAKNKKTN